MNIQKKIEEIKKKPEHIRIRYVWFLTAFCMFFILLIWEISIKTNVKLIQKNPAIKLDFAENKTIKDIQDKSKDIKKIKDNLDRATEKNDELQKESNNTENKSELNSELIK